MMMVLPIVYYVLFRYGPLYGAMIAFKTFRVKSGILASPWAQPFYKHFVDFFESPYFFQLLRNTLLISLYKLFWGMPFSIFLAVALNEVGSAAFKRTVQTITYLPHFLSWVIVYGISYALLSESMGLVNYVIRNLTGTTINFLSEPKFFRGILVASEVWRDVGWGAIIYLAAISGIDPTLYEAARIDGASRIAMIRYITLPSIVTVIVVLLILRMGRILEAGFEQVYVFYNVRVYSVGDIIDTWVFRTGLEQWNFSLASAVGLFKSVIGMILILIVNSIARRFGQAIW
jgi:putative aldouronate transport system permease protein